MEIRSNHSIKNRKCLPNQIFFRYKKKIVIIFSQIATGCRTRFWLIYMKWLLFKTCEGKLTFPLPISPCIRILCIYYILRSSSSSTTCTLMQHTLCSKWVLRMKKDILLHHFTGVPLNNLSTSKFQLSKKLSIQQHRCTFRFIRRNCGGVSGWQFLNIAEVTLILGCWCIRCIVG